MAWGDEMRVSQELGQIELNNVGPVAAPAIPGLAGWVLRLLRVWRGRREMQREQLKLVETLSLGGKRQLMLVTCAGERFLVGGGPESVETIVRLRVRFRQTCRRRVWTSHVDSTSIAVDDLGNGSVDDASAFGSCPDTASSDGDGLLFQ